MGQPKAILTVRFLMWSFKKPSDIRVWKLWRWPSSLTISYKHFHLFCRKKCSFYRSNQETGLHQMSPLFHFMAIHYIVHGSSVHYCPQIINSFLVINHFSDGKTRTGNVKIKIPQALEELKWKTFASWSCISSLYVQTRLQLVPSSLGVLGVMVRVLLQPHPWAGSPS